MQLNQLILRLQQIQALVTTDPQVLWRDPGTGMLYDEITPYLSRVFEDDEQQLQAFDLQLDEEYVEL